MTGVASETGGRLGSADAKSAPPTGKEATMAFALQQFWFASLVGWSAGLISVNDVVDEVAKMGAILERGIEEDRGISARHATERSR